MSTPSLTYSVLREYNMYFFKLCTEFHLPCIHRLMAKRLKNLGNKGINGIYHASVEAKQTTTILNIKYTQRWLLSRPG